MLRITSSGPGAILVSKAVRHDALDGHVYTLVMTACYDDIRLPVQSPAREEEHQSPAVEPACLSLIDCPTESHTTFELAARVSRSRNLLLRCLSGFESPIQNRKP